MQFGHGQRSKIKNNNFNEKTIDSGCNTLTKLKSRKQFVEKQFNLIYLQ